MDLRSFYKALETAWEQKRSLLKHAEAIRLLNAEASGTPRLVFELYGEHALLYDYGSGLGNQLKTATSDWHKRFGWSSVSLIDRMTPGDEGREGHLSIAGSPPEESFVREGSLRFRIEPCNPRNVGLFLDTRELRAWLFEHSHTSRILNLFSYTGSLGLAALSGGAMEVVNVDISQRYLNWGLANVRLNNLPEQKCRFIRMDSERYLDWAVKKNLAFNQVVLDPPVFSRFDGRVFRFEEDYFRLAAKSASLLSAGGTLHAVTNYSGIDATDFSKRLEEALRDAGKRLRSLHNIPLPPDFDISAGSEARCEGNALMLRVEME